MIRIFSELSKYIILILIALYTLKCFVYLTAKSDLKRRNIMISQIIYMFFIHAICYANLFILERDVKILVLYLAELCVAVLYEIFMYKLYKHASKLLTNNMLFLMNIGYIVLTRLNYDKALRQFILGSIGLFLMLLVPFVLGKIKKLRNLYILYAVFGILFLLTVFIPGLGITLNGASNWIKIAGLTIQPMEFVKILFLFFVAGGILKAERLRDFFINACISALFMVILVLENDFGAVLIFYICYIMMVYLATGRPIFVILGLGLLVLGVAGGYVLFKDTLFKHIMVRVQAWQDPFMYRETGGYQVSEALFAIGTGGFVGTGLGRGMPNLVPVVTSDFIFAAICEELGAIFGLAVILIYLSIFISIQNIAMKCKDTFYKYLTYGIGICIVFQVFLNIGGVTKFIPSTGITLPLISSGVSSLYSTLILMSIIQYVFTLVSKEGARYEKERERAERRERELLEGEA
ncbi:MAG: FtsW/RodA/SpoVE family cell cycle protein [Eubacterium sp.]|nr:FtsW/RodA/SpoVE family cell cycle protein [Eubacterium sp.]